MSEATSGTFGLQLPHIAALMRATRSSIGALPASAPARPISTMYTAKTQFVRQPQRNRCLLRSIAYHRHHGPPAWIDPVVLRAITISWNDIVIPVGSRRYDGHPDDGSFPWFTNDLGGLRMRCGAKRAQVTQGEGRSQSYDRYPHALTSLPHTACNSDIQRCSSSCRCQWVYRTSNAPEPQRLIYEDGRPVRRSEAAPPTFDFNNLIYRAIIGIAGWRHGL